MLSEKGRQAFIPVRKLIDSSSEHMATSSPSNNHGKRTLSEAGRTTEDRVLTMVSTRAPRTPPDRRSRRARPPLLAAHPRPHPNRAGTTHASPVRALWVGVWRHHRASERRRVAIARATACSDPGAGSAHHDLGHPDAAQAAAERVPGEHGARELPGREPAPRGVRRAAAAASRLGAQVVAAAIRQAHAHRVLGEAQVACGGVDDEGGGDDAGESSPHAAGGARRVVHAVPRQGAREHPMGRPGDGVAVSRPEHPAPMRVDSILVLYECLEYIANTNFLFLQATVSRQGSGRLAQTAQPRDASPSPSPSPKGHGERDLTRSPGAEPVRGPAAEQRAHPRSAATSACYGSAPFRRVRGGRRPAGPAHSTRRGRHRPPRRRPRSPSVATAG